ncbi:MAG TPA: nicotinate-nucleotide--dimethylbenzimidazole phosphoribosyltransferase [Coriobacteriia bacterium]|nr:nicotinate-nucleotide--dimethylbenzimidazole phosphoribosyltransferase [Coriobacteriia bacterium]
MSERVHVAGDPRDLRDLVALVQPVDQGVLQRAWARLDSLTKPPRSLGRVEELAARLAAIQGTERPAVTGSAIILMAADHGVVVEGVSAYPQSVTAQMLANFAAGGAAINQIARAVGADLFLYDVGVAADTSGLQGVRQATVSRGTANLRVTAAMSRAEAMHAILTGAHAAQDAADHGANLIGTGEMGIGNTTSAAALTAALIGVEPASVVGPGTGLDADGVRRKVTVVQDALARTSATPDDPVAVLASVGGLEIAALCGVILGAAGRRACVVIDGFISTAAALVAVALCPAAIGYLVASHRSAEPGHQVQLDYLGMEPLLDLGMRLGEGTGAALAMPLVRSACETLTHMATFAEAGVAGSVSA